VPAILQLDCGATDFFRDQSWPTYLCYNPYAEPRCFDLAVGPQAVDLYELVNREFVKRAVRDRVSLTLPADSAAVFVAVPAGAKTERRGARLLVDGAVLDYGLAR
jgi:hypothetical protein